MKKYIILVFILFLSFNKVYANQLINMGYNYIDDNSTYYYDKEDYIYNYGEWKSYNNEKLENIEIKTFYKYNKIPKVRYIHIYDGGIGTDELKLSELKILNGIEEINYESKCTHCNSDTLNYLKDNMYEFDRQFVMDFKFGYLIIDLLNEYEIKDLNIKVYLNHDTSKLKMYNIGFSTTEEKNNFITTKYFEEDVYSYKKNVMYEYKVTNNWNINYNYMEEYESNEMIEDSIFNKKIGELQKYRVYDLKYKTYMINEVKKEEDEIIINNIPEQVEPIEVNNIIPYTNIVQTHENYDNDTVEDKDIKEKKETTLSTNTFKETTKYKTITNKTNNNLFGIIYIVIIINMLIIIVLLNVKKMSYEK